MILSLKQNRQLFLKKLKNKRKSVVGGTSFHSHHDHYLFIYSSQLTLLIIMNTSIFVSNQYRVKSNNYIIAAMLLELLDKVDNDRSFGESRLYMKGFMQGLQKGTSYGAITGSIVFLVNLVEFRRITPSRIKKYTLLGAGLTIPYQLYTVNTELA